MSRDLLQFTFLHFTFKLCTWSISIIYIHVTNNQKASCEVSIHCIEQLCYKSSALNHAMIDQWGIKTNHSIYGKTPNDNQTLLYIKLGNIQHKADNNFQNIGITGRFWENAGYWKAKIPFVSERNKEVLKCLAMQKTFGVEKMLILLFLMFSVEFELTWLPVYFLLEKQKNADLAKLYITLSLFSSSTKNLLCNFAGSFCKKETNYHNVVISFMIYIHGPQI